MRKSVRLFGVLFTMGAALLASEARAQELQLSSHELLRERTPPPAPLVDNPPFVDIAAGLTGVYISSVAWGDYDNDGDLDILLTGALGPGGLVSRVYRNDNGSFVDIAAGLTDVVNSAAAWGDYDNDGDLDILLMGDIGSHPISRVYRNDGGSFVDFWARLPGIYFGSAAWGDYDNDGDLDILMAGAVTYIGPGFITVSSVYRNDDGHFVDIAAGLTGVFLGSAAWGDCDNDGDLDILLTGDTGYEPISRVYRNDNGDFVDMVAGLPGVNGSSVAWGDCDNDGDLDILITGYTGSENVSRVYRNDDGSFADIAAGLPGVNGSSAAWGDYDNDGDLDILLTGAIDALDSQFISRVYRNDDGCFVDIAAGLPGVSLSSVAWGDYDNDGDLDILLTGCDEYTVVGIVSRVYRNDAPAATNSPPSTPTNLSAQLDGSTLTLQWDPATDAETPTAGLTYNLRVGTTPGGSEVCSAQADPTSGLRLLAQSGNTQHNTSWSLDVPAGQIYYWSVQAVDASFAGSAFAPEQIYDTVTGVADSAPSLAFALHQNSPNPFNPRTTIRFEMKRPAHALLQVFDVAGRFVTTLVDEERGPGTQEVVWQGKDSNGDQVATGVYLYELRTADFVETRRMALLK